MNEVNVSREITNNAYDPGTVANGVRSNTAFEVQSGGCQKSKPNEVKEIEVRCNSFKTACLKTDYF